LVSNGNRGNIVALRLLRYILFTILFFAGLTAGAFLLAGTWLLPAFWLVFAAQAVFSCWCILVLDPDLISERIRPKGEDLDRFGRPVLSALYLVQIGLAALDVGRLHFSDKVPPIGQFMAFLLLVLAFLGLIWTMRENRFFSSAVRLQEDRGQTVISTGPYYYVRHPGYIFGSVLIMGQSIALGSWLSALFGVIFVVLLIKRTLLEEDMLSTNLPGYKEYARTVRYRWLPGIW
jgi:protein-S-isoprenylcysteine O-methyltransferase Ste14